MLTLCGIRPVNKAARLAELEACASYRHARIDLADRDAVATLFAETRPEVVVNLAAQAGVRYSLEKPEAYVDSNVVGFLNVLEGCRATAPRGSPPGRGRPRRGVGGEPVQRSPSPR